MNERNVFKQLIRCEEAVDPQNMIKRPTDPQLSLESEESSVDL